MITVDLIGWGDHGEEARPVDVVSGNLVIPVGLCYEVAGGVFVLGFLFHVSRAIEKCFVHCRSFLCPLSRCIVSFLRLYINSENALASRCME